jgi:transposase-like protein
MTKERQRRSANERTNVIERWQRSGLTARAFAEQEGLHASLLYQWRKQLKAAERAGVGADDSKPAFSELRLSTTNAQPGHVEIIARNGRVVRVHGAIGVRALQQVLAAVEQC